MHRQWAGLDKVEKVGEDGRCQGNGGAFRNTCNRESVFALVLNTSQFSRSAYLDHKILGKIAHNHFFFMKERKRSHFLTAAGGTIAVHVLLGFLLLAWTAADAASQALRESMEKSLAQGQEALEEVELNFVEPEPAPQTAPPPTVAQNETAPPPQEAPKAEEKKTEEVAAAAPPPPDITGIKFIDTVGMKETPPDAEPSSNAVFLSDRNTKAASEMAAVAGANPNLPTQAGMKDGILNLTNKAFIDGEVAKGAREKELTGTSAPKPQPKLQEPPLPTPEPPPPSPQPKETPPTTMEPGDESGSIIAEKPPEPKPEKPPLDVTLRPPDPANLFKQPQVTTTEPVPGPEGTPGQETADSKTVVQGFTRKNKMAGGVTTLGQSSVDAADTPQGRYMARVSDCVQKTFQPACARMRGKLAYGSVPVSFDISSNGKPSNITLVDMTRGHVVNQEVALDAIARATFPPIPPDLKGYLIDGKLNISFLFTFR